MIYLYLGFFKISFEVKFGIVENVFIEMIYVVFINRVDEYFVCVKFF